jgi:5-methylcytosine-specific restriction endonuclease McrA
MKIITRVDARSAGLKRYFTGEKCHQGHVAERRVSDHGCVECSRLKAASPKERERRREYMAAHQRQYRKKHPDRIKAVDAKRDKPKLAADKRAIRAANPEPHRAALSKSFQKHKAKRMAETREWKRQNPDANSRLHRAAKARRRAIELAAEGSYTRQDIERMLVEQNFVCAACPADISKNYQVDHMTPLSRVGGTNFPANLQLLCPRCNRSKGAKTMSEWIAWRAALQAPLLAALAQPRPVP